MRKKKLWVQGLVTTKPYKATRDCTQKHVPCFWHLHMLFRNNKVRHNKVRR